MRSLLVLLFGVVVSFVLYVATDQSLGSGTGIMDINPNFATVMSMWRALGGTVGPIDTSGGGGSSPFAGGGRGGMPSGEPPFLSGRGSRHGSGFGEGINLERASAQLGSDVLWVGIPALLGVAIELTYWHTRKRTRQKARRREAVRRET
jgi:hypothetical protein